MTRIYTENALLHPIRAARRALRRLLINRDNNDPLWDGGEIPAYLQQFHVGESLPWKGIRFKVGKIVGGDFPVLILVPVDRTHGDKLRLVRSYRDVSRLAKRERRAITESMKGIA